MGTPSDIKFLSAFWGAIALVGLTVIGYECFTWLIEGYWTWIPFSNFFPPTDSIDWTNMKGVKKMVDELLSFDIGATLFLVGGLISVSYLNSLNRSR